MQAVSSLSPWPLARKRLAFLGDSITDGHTLPLLVEQSLQRAGVKPPRCTNVGVAGNQAADMLARLERDVIPLRPDYLTLSAGVNDAGAKVPGETYRQTVGAILDRLRRAGIRVIILTTTPLRGERNEPAQPYLAAYNNTLRRLASGADNRLADLHSALQRALEAGERLLGPDGIHVAYAGYRIMARVLLDTLGYPQVPVVATLQLTPLPGVVRQWQIRPAPTEQLLTDKEVASLPVDVTWEKFILPESAAHPDDWWLDQERQRGFAIGLGGIGSCRFYHGLAAVTSPTPRPACLNTGADLQTIWLNGRKVYQTPGNSGWHAGRERVPVVLQAGRNDILIETGACFFLSITKNDRW